MVSETPPAKTSLYSSAVFYSDSDDDQALSRPRADRYRQHFDRCRQDRHCAWRQWDYAAPSSADEDGASSGHGQRHSDHRSLPLAGGFEEPRHSGLAGGTDEVHRRLPLAGKDSPGGREAPHGTDAGRELRHPARTRRQVLLQETSAGGEPGIDLPSHGAE